MAVRVLEGDALTVLRTLDAQSVQCCVTSPPYWGLRDYGVEGQIGLEATPDEFVGRLVEVFQEVKRVLRDDGTLWLNLGDSYAGSGKGPSNNSTLDRPYRGMSNIVGAPNRWLSIPSGVKAKDLVGIPWLCAFALRADGWYLRSDIIWHKPNPMPESVTDRPTKSHEYLFLLSKNDRYYYDADAIAEPSCRPGETGDLGGAKGRGLTLTPSDPTYRGENGSQWGKPLTTGTTRNARSVWTVSTSPYSDAHFATFPPKLIEPCILAGSAKGQTVLDPFGGAGTTGLVADRLGRDALLIELNPKYAEMARRRIHSDNPLFGDVA